MAEHDILVSIDPAFGARIAADWLTGVARITLEMERTPSCQLSVVVTGDEQIRQLNREFAGEDHATDVLSFSLCEGETFVAPDDTDRLGEVIVSFETAERQADEARHHVEDEVAHLLVHGVLHILGYDHAEPPEELRMRSRERLILSELGYEAHA
ncbi:MAG: rRNA maturation RNase YbeY [Chloroflexota bacterium]|nr:rRNA maturation RNase YbeY [Chloroflexota bacterium]